MINIIEKVYDKLREVYGPKHFTALLGLVVIIAVVGFLIGLKYDRYIKNDPDYCNSCHLMKKQYDDWGVSDHKTVTCQQCHKLGTLEQNSLLIKTIIYGTTKVKQEHGRKLPWKSCADCHWELDKQGEDLSRQSFGHFRHKFLECLNCHPIANHNFPPDVSACSKCHRDKSVHGTGMKGLSCIDCHIFSMREGTERNRVIPTRKRCMRCHENTMSQDFPAGSPMLGLECFECHKPHSSIIPDDGLCLNCHGRKLKDMGHLVHNMACKTCHKPHGWTIKDPRVLCATC
ncbi:MAG TPA: NapC/NirT family cytochrome c, partial [Nitrospirota bacterium]